MEIIWDADEVLVEIIAKYSWDIKWYLWVKWKSHMAQKLYGSDTSRKKRKIMNKVSIASSSYSGM